MKNLKNLFAISTLILIASCEKAEKLSQREICITGIDPVFHCNDQRQTVQDYSIPYQKGFIVMRPSEFNDLINQYQSLREKYIKLKRRR